MVGGWAKGTAFFFLFLEFRGAMVNVRLSSIRKQECTRLRVADLFHPSTIMVVADGRKNKLKKSGGWMVEMGVGCLQDGQF